MEDIQEDRAQPPHAEAPPVDGDAHAHVPNDLTALWRDPAKLRLLRMLVVLPLLLLFLTVFVRSTYSKHETFVNSFEVWGVFHYYLGAVRAASWILRSLYLRT